MCRRLLACCLVSLLLVSGAYADVALTPENFPDEVFRSYVKGFDVDSDDVLSTSELISVDRIDVYYIYITDLSGIEYFTNLKELDCSHNNIHSLNLNNNARLEYLCCDVNQSLTELYLRANKALKSLNAQNCGLISVDVGGLENLTQLNVSDNQSLAYLNFSGCTSLYSLGCDGTNLTTLDLSGCKTLYELYCRNSSLIDLNVSGCERLQYLYCSKNYLTELDVGDCKYLYRLDCYDNNLSSIHFNGNCLEYLYCYNNNIDDLDLSTLEPRYWVASNGFSKGHHLVSMYCDDDTKVVYYYNEEDKEDKFPVYAPLTGAGSISYRKRLAILEDELPDGIVNKPYSFDLTIQGEIASSDYMTFGISGLPNGLRGQLNGSTITISGNAYQTGQYPITINLSNNYYYDSSDIPFKPINTAPATGIYLIGGTVTKRYTLNIKDVDSPVEDAKLKVDVLESTNARSISNIIQDVASLSDGGYLNAGGKSLTESELSTFSAQTYSKKGFTADGNTRLILRAQSNKPGLIRFSVPASLDARLENLSRDHWASSFIDIPTTEIASNTHQASAVLIAPETYPLELGFPSANFRLRTFLIGDEGETQSNDLYLTVEAAPVILIHGLESNSTSAFRIGGSQGIHHRLMQDGFYVDYWDYDGTKGPEDIFREPGSGLFMKIVDVFDVYKAKNIACTRVDIVAHSMGGLMARRFLETEDCYSARSYMQGMVRRIVTVATPHEGSPIASYFMKDFSVLHNSDLYESYILSYMRNLRGVIKTSYESALNFGKSADSAFRDLSINSPLTKRLKRTPSDVPLFSLYGECKTAFNEYIDIFQQYLDGVEYAAAALEVLSLESLPKIVECLFKIFVSDKLAGYLNPLDKGDALNKIKAVFRILYGDDDYDLMVGAKSALSIFDGASLSRQGLGYHHTSICGQEDIGAFVSNLLKGSKDRFSDTRNYSASSTKSIVSASENKPVDSPEEIAYDDLFTEHYVISSSVNSITVPASATLTISSTKEFAYPIYISLKDDESCKLTAISADGQTSAQITLEFSSQDTGIIEISCFSGSDEGLVYISNNLKIAVLPELDDAAGLGFLHDNMTLHVNKGSEIPVNVFARKNDGTLFDVASGLTGTVWTVQNPLIAEVTDDGNVVGLSEGTTILTASYKDFTASISVDVGAEIVTLTESEDITSPDIDSPDIIAPAITTTSLASGQVASSCSAQLQASGTEPITWSLVSGDLPSGLTLNTSGLISGTPSSSGTFTFTVAATNDAGQDTKTLSLTVNTQQTPTPSPSPSITPPSISASSLPEGTTGTYYSAVISASGSRPITFTLTAGTLPEGLNFNNGSITGTPEESGSFPFTVRAVNSAGSVQRQFTLTVNNASNSEPDYEDIAAPSITSSIPVATVGRYYIAYISASGTKPVNFSITAGNIPDGLNFSDGMISGIPAEAGTFTFTITASNRGGITESDFTITVNDSSVEKNDNRQDGQDEQIGQETNSEAAAPDIVVGRSRSISSLSISAINMLSNDTSIIAAVLPEIRCNKSGRYTFGQVQIYPDIPSGSVLVWNAFASGNSDYDNSYADFLDVHNSEISQVPDEYRINIAAYLEAEKIYAPVITAIVPSSNNHDNTSESGGGGGGGCNSALYGIIFAVLCGGLARRLIVR